MPRFALLFESDGEDEITEADQRERFRQFVDWAQDLADRGHYSGSEALGGPRRRVRGKSPIDGPSAEAHEVVNGFIVVEATDFEAAVTLARECPALAYGWTVEVVEALEIPRPSNQVVSAGE